MRNYVFTWIVTCLLSQPVLCQNFTWMHGSALGGAFSAHGALGVPSSTNVPGGRQGSATWTDTLGKLWLFGGEGYLNSTSTLFRFSDLWKFDPQTEQWTWMKGANVPGQVSVYGTIGVGAPSNMPGARHDAASWTDNNGFFYLFGGFGHATTSTVGLLADLWRFDPYNNEWTWLKGPDTTDQHGVYGTLTVTSTSSTPGARYGAATWLDVNGHLWLFGGFGLSSSGTAGFLNDLWRYDPATNTWTWMHGSNATSQLGNYGTLSVASVSNSPGARQHASSFTGNDGNLYLFGGSGLATTIFPGYMNDMWRYSPATHQWTWIKGTNVVNQHGNYGTLHVTSATTLPGGRDKAVTWKDAEGNCWIFGGDGYEVTGVCDLLNDLFKYDVSNNTWTWMKGANFHLENGNYGAKGIASASNIPGARNHSAYWKQGPDKRSLWLFGGLGMDDTSSLPYYMNDLWKFEVPCHADSILITGSAAVCSGDTVTLIAYSQFPANITWFAGAGSTVAIASGSVFTTAPLHATASPGVYSFYASSNGCELDPPPHISFSVHPLPLLQVLPDRSSVCAGDTLQLTANGAHSYSWTGVGTGSVIVVSPDGPFTQTVTGTDTTGCVSSIQYSQAVFPKPVITILSADTAVCEGKSTILTASGAATYTWHGAGNGASFSVSPISRTVYSVTGTDTAGCKDQATFTLQVLTTPQIHITSTDSIVCSGNPVTLTATGAASFLWEGYGATPVLVITPTAGTVFSVTGTGMNGCTAVNSFSLAVKDCAGLPDGKHMNSLSAFPNPNKGSFAVSVPAFTAGQKIVVTDLSGKIIAEASVETTEMNLHLSVEPGMYFVRLYNDKRFVGVARIVIE